MQYDWDPEKDALNRRKHGLRLEDGIPVVEDLNSISWVDDRFDYGEERIITLGPLREDVLFVVTATVHDDLTRIISVRRAEKHEEYWFYHGRP
jgi:uncharacterized protein